MRVDINHRFDNLEGSIKKLEKENAGLHAEISTLKAQVYYLEQQQSAKIDDLENRSRGNNLLFFGVNEETSETWDKSELEVKSFMTDTLQIPKDKVDNIAIERAHRVGKNKGKRLICVKFLNWEEKQLVFDTGKNILKADKKFNVKQDF